MNKNNNELRSSLHRCPISTCLFTSFTTLCLLPRYPLDLQMALQPAFASSISTSFSCVVLLLLFPLAPGSEGDVMNKLLLSGVRAGQQAGIHGMVG